jgi:hypothetical protein
MDRKMGLVVASLKLHGDSSQSCELTVGGDGSHGLRALESTDQRGFCHRGT